MSYLLQMSEQEPNLQTPLEEESTNKEETKEAKPTEPEAKEVKEVEKVKPESKTPNAEEPVVQEETVAQDPKEPEKDSEEFEPLKRTMSMCTGDTLDKKDTSSAEEVTEPSAKEAKIE